MTGAILSATDKWGDVGKKGADARVVKQSKVHRKPTSGTDVEARWGRRSIC